MSRVLKVTGCLACIAGAYVVLALGAAITLMSAALAAEEQADAWTEPTTPLRRKP